VRFDVLSAVKMSTCFFGTATPKSWCHIQPEIGSAMHIVQITGNLQNIKLQEIKENVCFHDPVSQFSVIISRVAKTMRQKKCSYFLFTSCTKKKYILNLPQGISEIFPRVTYILKTAWQEIIGQGTDWCRQKKDTYIEAGRSMVTNLVWCSTVCNN
jgi:hypothetical protein